MATEGQWRGDDDRFVPPSWVSLVQVARWARVPAWELAEAPSMWRDRYSAVMEAEAHAAAVQRQRQQTGR